MISAMLMLNERTHILQGGKASWLGALNSKTMVVHL